MFSLLFVVLLLPFAVGNHPERYYEAIRITCVHGNEVNGACICDDDYVGTHCQYKMMCSSYERHLNGSCLSCLDGFVGDRCETIYCLHGKQKLDQQECLCDKPYGGKFCNELDTRDVYSYYNKKILILGPLGIISLIPMIAIYFGCEYYAKKRQIKRITKTLDIQSITVKSKAVKQLLANRVDV